MKTRAGFDDFVLRVKKAAGCDDLPLPSYATEEAAGIDLRAAIAHEAGHAIAIMPGGILSVPTGIEVEIPKGYEGQVRGRSGLAFNHNVFVPHAGTIDSDYRGEIRVIIKNEGREAFMLRRGDRIAQLVISPVARVIIEEATELSSTERGRGGFGSTGTK